MAHIETLVDDKVHELELLVRQLDKAEFGDIPMLCTSIRTEANRLEALALEAADAGTEGE